MQPLEEDYDHVLIKYTSRSFGHQILFAKHIPFH